MNVDSGAGGTEPETGRAATGETEPRNTIQSTVGTGSVLGIGCLVVVVLLVLVALIYRWLGGTW